MTPAQAARKPVAKPKGRAEAKAAPGGKARVGVLGSGVVGETLADGFLKKGYAVMRGSRDPGRLEEWLRRAGPRASTGTFGETARFGEVVVFAVKGEAAEEAVRLAGPEALAGKTVVDTMNPIAGGPSKDGLLSFFTGPDESLLERVRRAAPGAEWVKAFSCVGAAHMVDPDFGGEKPTMFLCGDSPRAKERVEGILGEFGWEWEDLGGVAAARAIEPLCILWCLPGFLRNEWSHAFRLLRK